jgi:hypothetical protein
MRGPTANISEQIYHVSSKMSKNEMGGALSAYGGGERRVQGFDGET